MILFGNIVIYIIMACALIGCLAYVFQEGSELGQQFLEGIYAIGPIFIPVAGVMAAAPYISGFIRRVFGPAFNAVGSDASIAAETIIATDMGGYQLGDLLAASRETWVMSMIIGFMAGTTIVYSIPVALKMLKKRDQPYLALGMLSGFITIPVGVFVSCIIIVFTNPVVRETISTNSQPTYQMAMTLGLVLRNLLPLIIICVAIALGLLLIPNFMIKAFSVFGKVLDSALTIILVLCIIEYFTGIFSKIFGGWGFEPIIADEADVNRALEISGYIGIMLCGAYPMLYLIKRYLSKPLEKIGKVFGLSADCMAGLLATAANVIALFGLIENMKAEDKVKCLAFAVCGTCLIGDHLAFSANYQPTLILPIMVGKLVGGLLAVWLATKISKPRAEKIEAMQMAQLKED